MPERQPSRVQQLLGGFAPKMVSLTDDVLFGDIWERAESSPRDRSLITVGALIATGSTEQLPGHLASARANGLTQNELKEPAQRQGHRPQRSPVPALPAVPTVVSPIPTVVSPILPAVPAPAHSMRHDRGRTDHSGGASNRSPSHHATSANSTSTQHLSLLHC
jgi:4-carboxymuconolactone decarboxylase